MHQDVPQVKRVVEEHQNSRSPHPTGARHSRHDAPAMLFGDSREGFDQWPLCELNRRGRNRGHEEISTLMRKCRFDRGEAADAAPINHNRMNAPATTIWPS